MRFGTNGWIFELLNEHRRMVVSGFALTLLQGKELFLTSTVAEVSNYCMGRGGGGQVVSVLAFYSYDPSSYSSEAFSFSVKFAFEKNKNELKRRPTWPTLLMPRMGSGSNPEHTS